MQAGNACSIISKHINWDSVSLAYFRINKYGQQKLTLSEAYYAE